MIKNELETNRKNALGIKLVIQSKEQKRKVLQEQYVKTRLEIRSISQELPKLYQKLMESIK